MRVALFLLTCFLPIAGGATGLSDYGQTKTLCGYGGSRENCVPIDGSHVATFVDAITSSKCFLTDTAYTVGGQCEYLKHYGNGVITYSTGGLYQYTDHQSSRHQYQRGDVEFECGGGGGTGVGHSQGVATSDGSTTDFFVLRKAKQSLQEGGSGGASNVGNGVGGNNGPHHDWYELKGGVYKFGYYECDRIVQGGAVDDYQYHYFCSSGYDLYAGCVASCGSDMADYTSFNFTSVLFGEVEDTSTSQIFS